jgi:release factor glutamine methyltransferase
VNWTTPAGRKLFVATHADVYVPSDDTFLLARAVAAEAKPGQRFLEVGCGAGLAAMVAASLGCTTTATDANPHAVALARHNAQQNSLRLTVVEGDLLAALPGPFDLVVFNPPYLPTAPDEIVPGPLNLAFDGGPDGNTTVLRFAAQVAALRPPPGTVLVVHSSLSDPAPLDAALGAAGYSADIMMDESHFFERLAVRRYRLAS